MTSFPSELLPLYLAGLTIAGAWILFLWMRWRGRQDILIDDFQTLLAEWAGVVFPESTLDSVLNHMRKEIEEARDNPGDVSEFADLFILLNQAATKAGHPMSAVIVAAIDKHGVNLHRAWGDVNEEGFREHVRKT